MRLPTNQPTSFATSLRTPSTIRKTAA